MQRVARLVFSSLLLIGRAYWATGQEPAPATEPAPSTELAETPAPPPLRPDAPPQELLAQSVQFFRVGFSNKKSPFQIGWGIPDKGWGPVVRDVQAKALRDSGARWLWIHNPFGAIDGEIMQHTARVRLLELAKNGDRGASRVEKTFLPTMRRLLEGKYTEGRRVGVVCYFGNAATDSTLVPILEQGDMERWQELWELSNEPVRKLAHEFPGQVMLGADSIEELPADHPHFKLLKHLHENGLPVIGEPRFLASRPHLFDFGMIKVWRQDRGGFDRSNPDIYPTRVPLATNKQIRGPRFALFRDTRPNAIDSGRMTFGHLRNALRAGATPVLDMRGLILQMQSEAARKK